MAECVACGRGKDVGCVVCWDCFKHTERFTPLKFWNGSTESWQIYVAGVKRQEATEQRYHVQIRAVYNGGQRR